MKFSVDGNKRKARLTIWLPKKFAKAYYEISHG